MNSYKQSLCISIIRIVANIVMVAAIFFAMYESRRWPGWPSEVIFCMFFFGITIPVWLLAWRLVKFARRAWPAEFRSMINLPGKGEQLVSWRVLPPEERAFAVCLSRPDDGC